MEKKWKESISLGKKKDKERKVSGHFICEAMQSYHQGNKGNQLNLVRLGHCRLAKPTEPSAWLGGGLAEMIK